MRHFTYLSLLLIVLGVLPCQPATAEAGRVVTYTAWTPRALYFAFQAEDPQITGNSTAPLGQPWQDDAVAIYLDLNPTGATTLTHDCVRVVISAAGGATVQRAENGKWRDEPQWFQLGPKGTIRYANKLQGQLNERSTTDQAFQVELALNWELLNFAAPKQANAADPLPAIGVAFARYEQGDVRGVSCWPPLLREDDLANPSKWGRMEFLQSAAPKPTQGNTVSASHFTADPLVEGTLPAGEWANPGTVIFTRQAATTEAPASNIPQGTRDAVVLLSAWYTLDPLGNDPAHQPIHPNPVSAGPESPLYHLLQLREARRTGIDAFAVALPTDTAARQQLRARLAALVSALYDYEAATSARFVYDTPLLYPALDLSTMKRLDLRTQADRGVLEAALDDFYRQVPPQFRLTVTNAAGQPCYPVILAAPPATPLWDKEFSTRLGGSLQAKWGMPIGWLVDDAMKAMQALPDVLGACAWDATAGLSFGEGALQAAMIAPGAAKRGPEWLARREGEVYETGWNRLLRYRPDLVVIRSWNDFANGTEIAASRQYGYQYLDSTKLATIRLAQDKAFSLRVVRHTLPATLRQGGSYPVSLLLKNGTTAQLLAREGIRVDYRITRKGRLLLNGTATEELLLLELATAQLHFTLPMQLTKQLALPPGEYELHLDFRQSKTPLIRFSLTTRTLGELTIPFTISADGPAAQLVASALPAAIPADGKAMGSFQLRNLSGATWAKDQVRVRLRWLNERNTVLPGETLLPNPGTAEPGGIATFRGELPTAPAAAGWYRLRIEVLGANDAPLFEQIVAQQVTALDLRAEFLNIDMPTTLTGAEAQIEVPVALRNAGQTPWVKGQTRVTYQWLRWDGQPIPEASGAVPLPVDVTAGAPATVRLQVNLPAGGGTYRCAFGVEHAGQTALLTTHPATLLVPVYTILVRPGRMVPVDLKALVNDWAADSDTVLMKADIDGKGQAFPLEEFLPDATNPAFGYPTGYYTAQGMPVPVGFRFAPIQQGRAPMLRAKGQSIELPAKPAAALHLIATNTGTPAPLTVTIRYADGTESTQTVTVSNWLEKPLNGEAVMLKTRRIRTLQGDDWTRNGSLYAYRLMLDPTKPVKSIVLPVAPSVCLFAATLELPAQ